jgi:hypothetical protein
MDVWAHMLIAIPNNNTKPCNVLFRILEICSTFIKVNTNELEDETIDGNELL